MIWHFRATKQMGTYLESLNINFFRIIVQSRLVWTFSWELALQGQLSHHSQVDDTIFICLVIDEFTTTLPSFWKDNVQFIFDYIVWLNEFIKINFLFV